MSQFKDKILRKCSICNERAMIKIGELNCNDCEERIKKKNKSLLEI